MNGQIISQLLQRDLEKLKQELLLYRDETLIWKTVAGISNSAGNLCLHLVGNLNTYIGAELGQSGYIRNREQEFSQKDIQRDELIRKIENTILVVSQSTPTLTRRSISTGISFTRIKGKDQHRLFPDPSGRAPGLSSRTNQLSPQNTGGRIT
ncbi:MAG: hypothetical protein V9F01_00075 [Chitinophagaceae bacterium]